MNLSVLLPTVIALLFAVGFEAFGLGSEPPPPRAAVTIVIVLALLPLFLPFFTRRTSLAAVRRAFHVLELAPLALYVVEVVVLAWPVTVAQLGLEGWPLLTIALRLLPYAAMRLCSEVAKVQLSRPWLEEAPEPHTQALQRLRQESLLVAPFLLFSLGEAVLSIGRLKDYAEFVPGVHWLVVLANLIVLLVAFPMLIRWCFGLQTLGVAEGRDRIVPFLDAHGFRVRDVVTLPHGEQMYYAGLIGIFPRFRYFAVSRGLIQLLSQPELESVAAHEMGHGVKRHALQSVGSALTVLLGLYVLAEGLAHHRHPLSTAEDAPLDATTAILLLGCLPVMFFGGGFLLRSLEVEADLYAADVTGSTSGIVTSLDKMVVAAGLDPNRRGFRHPSVRARQRFLDLATREGPRLRRRFARGMTALRAISAIAAVFVLFMICRGVLADSAYGLAMLALREDRPEQAHARLDDALKLRAAHLPSLLAMLELELAAGRDVQPALDRLVALVPSSSTARAQVVAALTELQAERFAGHDFDSVERLRRAALSLKSASP